MNNTIVISSDQTAVSVSDSNAQVSLGTTVKLH